MNPELIDQVYRLHCQQDFQRKANHEQRHIENPGEQKVCTGLPQSGRQVVILTLMVHRLCCPENRDLVAEAMEPVVTEVIEQK